MKNSGIRSVIRTAWVIACVAAAPGVAHAQVCGAPALPAVTLRPGEYSFRVADRPTLLLGTNPYAQTPAGFTALFDGLRDMGNEKVVRLFVHSLPQDPLAAGAIDQTWLGDWDTVFCDAQAHGLYVLPVLDVWSNWNHVFTAQPPWSRSIYNLNSSDPRCRQLAQNGVDTVRTCGPATTPWELVPPGPTQEAWLRWVRGIVDHWKAHTNIIGWETFSEIDNIIGPTGGPQFESSPPADICTITPTDTSVAPYLLEDPQNPGVPLLVPPLVCLVEKAAAKVREVDARPVTASLKQVNDWSSLGQSSLDFLELHPYSDHTPIDGGNLDQAVLDHVGLRRDTYRKPVFIGESGLDEEFPDPAALTLGPQGEIGIRQAIWAGAVAGSMNARMLWYEDGYDVIGPNNLRVNLCDPAYTSFAGNPVCLAGGTLTIHEFYRDAAAPVRRFLTNEDGTSVDYAGFARAALTSPSGTLLGGALGNASHVIGWVRDVQSAAPSWPDRSLLGERITVGLTGQSPEWQVDFYNTVSGDQLAGETIYVEQDLSGVVTFALPQFNRSIAFQIHAVPLLGVRVLIKPGRQVNRINLRQRRPFLVAIPESSELDVSTINVSTVRLAGAEPVGTRTEDLDGDGFADVLLLQFLPSDTALTCGDSSATLTGETANGRSFQGSDSVVVVGGGCRR